MQEAAGALRLAVLCGDASPCSKSHRGVVIWRPGHGVIGEGNNHPPAPFTCDGSAACQEACNRVCVHAEAAALLDAHQRGHRVVGAEMLHVKVVKGTATISGPPSCWQCSRLILEAGIAGMWLLHSEGLHRYTAEEFHRLTLEHCKLPGPVKPTSG